MAEPAQEELNQRERDKVRLTKEEVDQLIAGVKTATSTWESQPHHYSVSGKGQVGEMRQFQSADGTKAKVSFYELNGEQLFSMRMDSSDGTKHAHLWFQHGEPALEVTTDGKGTTAIGGRYAARVVQGMLQGDNPHFPS